MLHVEHVTMAHGGRLVLDDVSLTVAPSEILALTGPSGSGKSTLLRVIAGLIAPDRGTIRWGSEDLSGTPTHLRNIGMVFQDEQLFPHLTVSRNIGFGLRMAKWDKRRINRRVTELLELVDLAGFEQRSVATLSGGEAKRVALARSIAPSPRVLLLDEPLTGLDSVLHDRLAVELRRILQAVGITAVHVTHDAAEATTVADRTVVLRSGGTEAQR